MRTVLLPVVLLGLAACVGGPRPERAEPPSLRIVCGAGGPTPACFRAASDRCGPAGYDLFDESGRPATLADAAYRPLVARCRR